MRFCRFDRFLDVVEPFTLPRCRLRSPLVSESTSNVFEILAYLIMLVTMAYTVTSLLGIEMAFRSITAFFPQQESWTASSVSFWNTTSLSKFIQSAETCTAIRATDRWSTSIRMHWNLIVFPISKWQIHEKDIYFVQKWRRRKKTHPRKNTGGQWEKYSQDNLLKALREIIRSLAPTPESVPKKHWGFFVLNSP